MTESRSWVDKQANEFVVPYMETVPSWWTRSDYSQRLMWGGGLVGALVFYTSTITMRQVSYWMAFIGFLAGAYLGNLIGKLAAKSNGQTVFKRELRVHRITGDATMASDYRAKYTKDSDGISPFHSREIRSIERRTYAEEYPDSTVIRSNNSKDRAEARSLERIVIVLDDGQEVSAGWQPDNHQAVRWQRLLIQFFTLCHDNIKDVGTATERPEPRSGFNSKPKFDPGDEPL